MSITFGLLFQTGHAPASPMQPMHSVHPTSQVIDVTPIAVSERYHPSGAQRHIETQQPHTYTLRGESKINLETGRYLDIFA